jgi:FkbH-like protein
MYEFDWAEKQLWKGAPLPARTRATRLPAEDVAATMLLHWQEHCHECAPPHCYEVCPLYVARADRKCARFVYGIYPIQDLHGLFDYGADISFRRWAKLETQMYGTSLSVAQHRRLAHVNRRVTAAVSILARGIARLNPRRRLNGALTMGRDRVLRMIPGQDRVQWDAFVLEVFACDDEAFRLVVECTENETLVLRESVELVPGHNFATIPASRFGRIGDGAGRILRVYPENDAERRLIFTWLDFVAYSPARKNLPAPTKAPSSRTPASQVKCVAWDLDNTLWDGILVEDGADACKLRDDARRLVHQLDERGILQTIVSKNHYAEAWALLCELELDEFFLYPAINWGQKSQNLLQIAESLNINIDTFALLDDSPFERAEVARALPMVRVYDIAHVEGLLESKEFDVPISAQSRTRRLSYLGQQHRERARTVFAGDYTEFLRSCGMKMRLFTPDDEGSSARCLELIQRSNQLNLSARRYSSEEFRQLLAVPGMLNVAFDCEDRFGLYGIVGFASVDERSDSPEVRDLVVSCRVMGKRVERSFLAWLATRERNRGRSIIRAQLVSTDRNGPLLEILRELPFNERERAGERSQLELRVGDLLDDHVIEVVDDVAEAAPAAR